MTLVVITFQPNISLANLYIHQFFPSVSQSDRQTDHPSVPSDNPKDRPTVLLSVRLLSVRPFTQSVCLSFSQSVIHSTSPLSS